MMMALAEASCSEMALAKDHIDACSLSQVVVRTSSTEDY